MIVPPRDRFIENDFPRGRGHNTATSATMQATPQPLSSALEQALAASVKDPKLIFEEAGKIWGEPQLMAMITSRPYSGAPLMGYVVDVKCKVIKDGAPG